MEFVACTLIPVSLPQFIADSCEGSPEVVQRQKKLMFWSGLVIHPT